MLSKRLAIGLAAALAAFGVAYAATVDAPMFQDTTQRTTTAGLAQQSASDEIPAAEFDANTAYIVFSDTILGGSQNSANNRFDLLTETVRFAYSLFLSHESQTATSGDGISIPVVARLVTDGTPDDLQTRYGNIDGVTTTRRETTTLIAISLAGLIENTDWFYDADTGEVADVGTTWVTTGPSFDIGDGASTYLVCGAAEFEHDDTSSDAAIRLFNVDATAAYSEMRMEGEDNTDQVYLGSCWVLEAPAAGTTLRLEYQNYDAATHDLHNRWLIALRLDAFEDFFVETSATGADVSSTAAWTEQLSATHEVNTADARDWFIMGQCIGVPEANTNRWMLRTTVAQDGGSETTLAGDGADFIATNGSSDRITRFLLGKLSSVADGTTLDVDLDMNSGTGTGYQCADNFILGFALDDSDPPSGGPAFDDPPEVTSQTDSAYVVEGSLDGAGTVYAVACLDGNEPANDAEGIAQVQAGDCGDDSDALAADNDSPSMGMFDFSLSLALSGDPPPYSSISVTDGASVVTLTDEFLDVPTGKVQIVLASVAMDSELDGTEATSGDVWRTDSAARPCYTGSNFDVTLYDDGHLSYDAGAIEDCRLIDSRFWDVSMGAWSIEETLVYNNPLVECEFFDGPIDLLVGEPIEYDFDALCEDPHGDTFTVTLESGDLPTGTALAMNVWSGTPSVAGENLTPTFRVTDQFNGVTDYTPDVNTYELVEVPDVVGDTVSDATDALDMVGLAVIETPAACSDAEAGVVVVQVPGAGTFVDPGTTVLIIPSSGVECARGAGGGLGLDVDLAL